MSKRTTALLIVAAVLVVAAVVWLGSRRASSNSAGTTTGSSTKDGTLAGAFKGFVQAGTNWAAQWFVDRVQGPPGGETASKPPAINDKGASVQAPVGATPNVVTSPTYFS